MGKKEKLHRKKIFTPKFFKVTLTALACLAQITVLVVPWAFFNDYMGRINMVLQILSILAVLYIVKSDINPSYKIPWIVVLLVLPVFGGLMYIVYGRYYFGKKERLKVQESARKMRQAMETIPYHNGEIKELDENMYMQANYLYRIADAPAFRNTTARFFPLGDDMLPVMLSELRKAKKFIFMEYFIVESGEMFDSILEVLYEKAANGVEVRFMYDSVGSILKAPGDLVKKLRKNGIQCYEYNTFRSILDSRFNNRDHRKICVIDGNTGFTGGINFADEYINKKQPYGHWKDTAIMLKGDAVWSFTTMFLSFWDSSFNQNDDFEKYLPTENKRYTDGYYAPYTDYPYDDETVGKNVYFNMITRANHYIYIMTPYLILDNVMISALQNAAKNGVDVRIITPGIPDKKIAYMLTQSYYEVLIKSGVKIYQYTPGFVHAKIFLSDDITGVVGTINLDYRSLTHHFEDAVWMYKTSVLEHIKSDYVETLEKCRQISYEESKKQSLIRRILLPVLRLFSPLF